MYIKVACYYVACIDKNLKITVRTRTINGYYLNIIATHRRHFKIELEGMFIDLVKRSGVIVIIYIGVKCHHNSGAPNKDSYHFMMFMVTVSEITI